MQELEPRLALTISASQDLMGVGATTFAYVLTIDDTINTDAEVRPGNGNTVGRGRDLYLQAGADSNTYFLVADNPAFENAQRLPWRVAAGASVITCTTVKVISASDTGSPQSFTFFASSTIPTQRLIADLGPSGSRISINSRWDAKDGTTSDPDGYIFAGGASAAGQIALYASEISIASPITSSSRFTANYGNRASDFTTPMDRLDVNASVQVTGAGGSVGINVTGSATDTAVLNVSEAGSLKAAQSTISATYADVRVLGTVNIPTQTYVLRAPGSVNQYEFTTRSAATGANVGKISGASVAITMGQPKGGIVDLATSVDRLQFQTGLDDAGLPMNYSVGIADDNDLTMDAVGGSSGPISISSGGGLTILGDAIRTGGGISLSAANSLTLQGSISTANGDISLRSKSLSLGSSLTAGGGRSVSLQSTTGDTTSDALVQAGGLVKQTVRVASTGNVPLVGTAAVDGVTLAVGDRVLLKNQVAASENGIYVYSATSGGTLTRATDANTVAKLQPGFVVFVRSGTQTGGWTFRNATPPILGQTALQFAPTSAVRTYGEVKAATTAAVSLSGIPASIDGVTVQDGDRVLVKNQANTAANGIYVVSAGAWQRASDADTTAELTAGSFVFVRAGGTANGGKGFAVSADVVQVGTTPLDFTNFFAATSGSTGWAPARALTDVAVATTVNTLLSGLQTIDGVQVTAGQRVLVKNQIDSTQNGIYVAAAGNWQRSTDADGTVNGPLTRGMTVYVTGGTQGGGSSWQFNDTSLRLATTVANSATVSGLVSTDGLAVGMLVTGAGIPSGTTIAALGADGTSVRLSGNAAVSAANVVLAFSVKAAATVGVDPVAFVPVGGAIALTAAGSIGGNSRFAGAAGLITAGTGAAAVGAIDVKTNVGRIAATAPGNIKIDNASSVELESLRTTKAGGVTVNANGTVTALAVAATGASGAGGVAGDVGLTSVYGDVVAEQVSSNVGSIALTSVNASVAVTKARRSDANVSAAQGNVLLTADAKSAVILVNGRLNAQDGKVAGTGGISLSSNAGSVSFGSKANVTAAGQLGISTPGSVVAAPAAGAQIASSSLAFTAKFGAGESAPPVGLGTPAIVSINRTDAGDISYESSADLRVLTASTLDGSISFEAPNLTVAGAILPQGTNADLSLTATSGSLFVDTAIGAQRDVNLSASKGEVRSSSGAQAPTALVTAGRDVVVTAASNAIVRTKAAGFSATLSAAGATLNVTDDDGLAIKQVQLSGGGTATFAIGTAASGGDATVGLIDVGTKGTLSLSAYGGITQSPVDAAADIVGGTVTLSSTAGKIDLDTDVGVLNASVQQKNQTIAIIDVGGDGLEIISNNPNNANVSIKASGTITATNVKTTGTISLATSGASSDIVVNAIEATNNAVTLAAGGSIKESIPTDTTADIVGSTVKLTATAGSIAAHVAAPTVTASATTAGKTIVLTTDGDVSLGGIDGRAVTVTAGGSVGQTPTGAILADSFSVTSTGGKNIVLNTAANTIGQFTATTTGSVLVKNATAGLVVTEVTATAVTLEATSGGITQTGAIKAGSLVVSGAGGAINLATQANQVDSFAATNGGGAILFKDTAGGLVLAGITGGTVTIDAVGAVTQTAAVNAGAFAVNAGGSAITLTNLSNAVTSFASNNASGAVSFVDGAGDLSVAGITGGSVSLAAAGSITQSAPIKATTLAVTANGPNATLDKDTNAVGSLGAISNPGGNVTFVNAAGFAVGGAMTAGTGAVGDGNILIKATTGSIAVNANLTAAKDRVTINAPLGTFSLANGMAINAAVLEYTTATEPSFGTGTTVPGTIEAHVTPPTPPTPPGGTVTTADQLQQAVAVINSLPVVPGTTYEIVVGASLTLTQTLFINRPVNLRGSSAGIVISGSPAVVNGLSLSSSASGSRISSLAFSGFRGTAIQLNSAQVVAISGIAVNNFGTGLAINGLSNGTTVQGSSFTNGQVAISLVSASGVTVGGLAAGQGNRITAAARAGVFASGACVNTQVIKTAFVRTRTPYSIATARFLRIVR